MTLRARSLLIIKHFPFTLSCFSVLRVVLPLDIPIAHDERVFLTQKIKQNNLVSALKTVKLFN